MSANEYVSQVAVIGAGPYGLSAAAYLRSAGVETCVLGEPMDFWSNRMPKGMLLRSSWDASHIADPGKALTLGHYERVNRGRCTKPIPLEQFVNYGRWFQGKVAPDVIRCPVRAVERNLSGFRLVLEDGCTLFAKRVVVAAGISPFTRSLPQLAGLPPEFTSHSSDHCRLDGFKDRRVMVVGSGQSALESAALLREKGADVEVLARAPQVHWLDQKASWLKSEKSPLKPLFCPATDIGPSILNWIVALPHLFRCLPKEMQERIAYRSVRPAGSGWLLLRLGDTPITVGRTIRSAEVIRNKALVRLDDDSERKVDHVIQATGYAVDIRHYPFLSQELLSGVTMVNGYPVLGRGFESSMRGLHFVGAPGAYSFGPLCRFVAGTSFTSRELSFAITGKRVHHSQILPSAAKNQ